MSNCIELGDRKIKRIALGTWGLSGGWGDNDFNEAAAKLVILKAVDSGIELIDTAQVYGQGVIESLLGKMQLPASILLATKIPAMIKPDNSRLLKLSNYYTPEYINERTKESITRMGRVDLLQLHNWHPSWNTNTSYFIEPLIKLRKAGLVRFIGVSLPDDYEGRVVELIESGIDFLQLPYNQFQTWAEKEIFALTQERQIPLLIRSIFGQGALLMPKDEIAGLENNDLRKKRYAGKNIMKVDAGETINQIKGLVPNGILLIGMRNKQQVEENCAHFKNE